ncbi:MULTISPECIES: ferrochelatase [Brucella/Ochrobactrum group]|uniref:ferrochelatase n=1 Tax=Brucella/Ochrobactrum group TaxID=2826938 RepID=UPI001654EF6C|nr:MULTISPECIES: ferrochelatase [Brucella/Ochrobactrum group]MBC8718869.1 ferrochelatase [Ochrobactrum sp. Marseille-Q0166]
MSETNKVIATPANHAAKQPKVGVLLVNLGTPDGTSYAPMRRYLAEFLSDRRVIEWPRLFWYPILYGIVLTVRPKRSGKLYDRIWNREKNESPLRTFTRAQGEKLAVALKDYPNVIVDWAMRYGQPSIEEVTDRLLKQGCERIVMFPLYPQYSATTTATVNDKFFEVLMKKRFMPAVRTIPSYEVEPVYIEALAQSIEKHLATLDFKPEVILASYHGIPKSYSDKGDPYRAQCLETSRLLRARLGMDDKQFRSTFQSRFGPEEWLQPYTDETVEELAKQGVKSVAVLNPGFVVDCLETVDEIGHEAAEAFHEAGGENFSHIPCLNDSEEGMKVIETLVRRELQGWV